MINDYLVPRAFEKGSKVQSMQSIRDVVSLKPEDDVISKYPASDSHPRQYSC